MEEVTRHQFWHLAPFSSLLEPWHHHVNKARISLLEHVKLLHSCPPYFRQQLTKQEQANYIRTLIWCAVDKRILPNLPEAGLENKNCYIYIIYKIKTVLYIYIYIYNLLQMIKYSSDKQDLGQWLNQGYDCETPF